MLHRHIHTWLNSKGYFWVFFCSCDSTSPFVAVKIVLFLIFEWDHALLFPVYYKLIGKSKKKNFGKIGMYFPWNHFSKNSRLFYS